MPIRLGLDFGTATTCLAILRDLADPEPEVIPLQPGELFSDSVVWFDDPLTATPLAKSRGQFGRAPLALFAAARLEFAKYWADRVRAQSDGLEWYYWKKANREKAMLLTFFKPELEDEQEPQFVLMPAGISYGYDPMAQSEDLCVYYSEREVANPAPETADLVAATAALIRHAVEVAALRHSERVELLAIGIPSHNDTSGQQAKQACERRRQAFAAAQIPRSLVTANFRIEFIGEAQAAGFGLQNISDATKTYAIVIDMGAGTTDLALIPYIRNRNGRMEAGTSIAADSLRFAGRNLNEALADVLKLEPAMRAAFAVMDARSWQLLIEEDVERIKRALTAEPQRFGVDLTRYAAHPEGCLEDEKKRRILSKSVYYDLSLRDGPIRTAVRLRCAPWRHRLTAFLNWARTIADDERAPIAAIELVGGAFKFRPLLFEVQTAARESGLGSVPIRFRDSGQEAQTVVARGLARWAAIQP